MDNLFYLPKQDEFFFFGFQLYVDPLKDLAFSERLGKNLELDLYKKYSTSILIVSQNDLMLEEKMKIYQELVSLGIQVGRLWGLTFSASTCISRLII